jgi:hypothetical protein
VLSTVMSTLMSRSGHVLRVLALERMQLGKVISRAMSTVIRYSDEYSEEEQ